jgi:hypothetical protein
MFTVPTWVFLLSLCVISGLAAFVVESSRTRNT